MRKEIQDGPWTPYLPALAPLSLAQIAHIFAESKSLHNPPPSPDLEKAFIYLWPYIQRARQLVSYFLVSAIMTSNQSEKITFEWFRDHFAIFVGGEEDEERPPLSYATMNEWIMKKHLRRNGKNSFDPNSVAALFMMRYLFNPKRRNWLAPRQRGAEPWFYVFGLLPGEHVPQIYPYPLPGGLPNNLLLFTQWMGASWQPGWIKVPGLGALAWGRIVAHSLNDWHWNIEEDDMRAWDDAFISEISVMKRLKVLEPAFQQMPPQGLPSSAQRYFFQRTQDVARLLLQRIGEPILAKYLLHYFVSDKPPKHHLEV